MESIVRRQTLGDLLKRTARRTPGKLAIQCGNISWTYAELDELCDRLAAGLTQRGVAPGDRIAVLARNSHAFVALRFALAKFGAILVPVNFMLNADAIAYILKHAGAKLLFVDDSLMEVGREAIALDTQVERLVWLPGEEPTDPPGGMLTFQELSSATADPPQVDLDAGSPAQFIYTSGTESLPKGVMLSHMAVISEYMSCIHDLELSEDDRVLHAMPLFHCAQLDAHLGPGIYTGATNIITSRPAAENILPLIERHRITSFSSPATVWISLLRSPLFDSCDLSSLRKGYYGASIMPVEVLLEMQRRMPNVRLWNKYGQTEMAGVAVVLKPEDQLRKAGFAGRPALNVESRIVDETGTDVVTGTIGEIVHRSPQLMSGYYRDEERTQAAFEGGWFHTGDLATMDAEGYITVVDRKKDMIKTGGENVSSREVEEAIHRISEVSEVAVIGLPHDRWVEAVTAVIVLRNGRILTDDAVIEHCKRQLAGFKVPKQVFFADALPKNPSGKVLKRDLRERYQSRAGTSG